MPLEQTRSSWNGLQSADAKGNVRQANVKMLNLHLSPAWNAREAVRSLPYLLFSIMCECVGFVCLWVHVCVVCVWVCVCVGCVRVGVCVWVFKLTPSMLHYKVTLHALQFIFTIQLHAFTLMYIFFNFVYLGQVFFRFSNLQPIALFYLPTQLLTNELIC